MKKTEQKGGTNDGRSFPSYHRTAQPRHHGSGPDVPTGNCRRHEPGRQKSRVSCATGTAAGSHRHPVGRRQPAAGWPSDLHGGRHQRSSGRSGRRGVPTHLRLCAGERGRPNRRRRLRLCQGCRRCRRQLHLGCRGPAAHPPTAAGSGHRTGRQRPDTLCHPRPALRPEHRLQDRRHCLQRRLPDWAGSRPGH